jgi:hypothetical protein
MLFSSQADKSTWRPETKQVFADNPVINWYQFQCEGTLCNAARQVLAKGRQAAAGSMHQIFNTLACISANMHDITQVTRAAANSGQ